MARIRTGLGRKAAIGFGVVNGGMMFYSRRSEHPEESKIKSAAHAAAETALYALLPGVAFAKDAFQMAASASQAGVFDPNVARMKKLSRMEQGASWNYQDTDQAYTMRQRGIQAIQESRLNARSAMGGEARSLSRGGFN